MRAPLALAALACAAFAGAQGGLVDSDADLVAALAEGGEYQVMPRTYVLDAPVVIRNDLRLVGVDRERVTIEAMAGPIAVLVEGDVGVHLEGLRLIYRGEAAADLIVARGARLSFRTVDLGFGRAGPPSDPPVPDRPDGHGSGLVLAGGASAAGDDLRIAQNQRAAIEMADGSTLDLVASTIVGNYQGLVGSGAIRVDVRASSFSGHFAHALLMAGDGLDATFVDTDFEDNGIVDIERQQFWPATRLGGASRIRFTGGAMRATQGIGLSLTGATHVTVDGMRFEGVGGQYPEIERTWAAVLVQGEARLEVADSVLIGNAGGAFEVSESGGLVLRGVRVEANGSRFHTRAAGDAVLEFRESAFVDNVGGVYVGGAAQLGLFGSELTGASEVALVVTGGARAEVTDTTVADFTVRGVWIDGSGHADLTRTIVSGTGTGVVLTGEATAMLIDNDLVTNSVHGVEAGGTSRVALDGNRVSGNAVSGVLIGGGASGVLQGNELAGNGEYGMVFTGTAMGQLDRNVIGYSPIGVHLEDTAAIQGEANEFVEVGMNVSDAR